LSTTVADDDISLVDSLQAGTPVGQFLFDVCHIIFSHMAV